MAKSTLPPPPRTTANPAPARPDNSVRRTASIDVAWPDGPMAARMFVGRARDYRTETSGRAGAVIEEAAFEARIEFDKTITSISANPPLPGLEGAVGLRGGNPFRTFLADHMSAIIREGRAIHLALDDIFGATIVSTAAFSQWREEWVRLLSDRMATGEFDHEMLNRVDICWGLQEGSSGLGSSASSYAVAEAGDLRNPADALGWHDFPEIAGPGFRRARRIDVMREAAGTIRIDAAFQDSAKRENGTRVAIHEYRLVTTADPDTLEILTLEPEPRILPYPECPGAVENARRLVGTSIGSLREGVAAQLRGPRGCTHLNDALRALADVPKLASLLPAL